MDYDNFNIFSYNNYDESPQQFYSKSHILELFDFNDKNIFSNNKIIINEQFITNCSTNQNENAINKNLEIENKGEFNVKKVKLLGKKTSNYKGLHDKYSSDNAIRKIRTILINNLTKFINNLIYEVYNGKINQGILKKELKKLNKSQTKNVKENKEFLYQTIKDIFSVELSIKYTNFSSSHNINIINQLLNEKDEEKRIKFETIFNLTILDCINNYKGIINIKEIEPLNELINEDLNNYKNEDEYFKLLSCYISDFERIIMRKKSRKGRKNN